MNQPANRAANDSTGASSAVAYVYDKGASGQPDVLVETRPLAALADVAGLSVSATRYIVLRDPADDGVKSVDNW